VTLGAVRALSIVHQRDSGSGVFARAAADRGDELVRVRRSPIGPWLPVEGDAIARGPKAGATPRRAAYRPK